MDDTKVQSIVKVKEEKEEEVEADNFDNGDPEVIMQSIVKEEEVKEEEKDEFEADNISDDHRFVDEDVKPPLCVFITSDGKYIEEGPFGSFNVQDPLQTNGIDPDAEHESGTPVLPTKKKSRMETGRKKKVTAKQDLKRGEIQPTDKESQRLNKTPKTSAEHGREFRARKALLKQECKQQQEPDAIVEIATDDIQSAGPSENNQVPEPSEITTIERRAKSAEATRRWRQKKKGVSESSKKQAKTAAQRMREYRERKKLAKKVLLEQQSNQDLDAIVSTSSSQVNQRAGPSTINSISAELTRRGNLRS